MKIKQKLTLGFIGIALLVTIVGLLSVYAVQKVLQKHIQNKSVAMTTNILNHIDRTIYLRVEQLQAYAQDLAHEPMLISSNREFEKLDNIQEYINKKDQAWRANGIGQTNIFMEDLISNKLSAEIRGEFELKSFYKERYGYEIFSEVFVTNKYGANAAQTDKTSDYYQADEQWWQEAKKKGLYVSDVEFDQSSEINSIAIGVRIDSVDGEFLGVIKAVVNIAEVINIVKAAADEYGSLDFKLLTGDNRIIYCTEGSGVLKSIPTELATLLQEKDSNRHTLPYFINSGDKSGEGEEFYSHAHSQGYKSYAGSGWILVIEQETKEIFAPVVELRNRILIVSLLITVLAIILGLFISRSISVPIGQLTAAAVKIGEGSLDTPVAVKSNDEIGQLAESFEKMTQDLKKTTTSIDNLSREANERKKAEESLRESMEQLERFNRLAMGREVRVIELKRQVNSLLAELNREPEYKSIKEIDEFAIHQDVNEE